MKLIYQQKKLNPRYEFRNTIFKYDLPRQLAWTLNSKHVRWRGGRCLKRRLRTSHLGLAPPRVLFEVEDGVMYKTWPWHIHAMAHTCTKTNAYARAIAVLHALSGEKS